MELIEAIKKAGVVGAGGAGFPTHVKLNAKAEYLIINAAECEPLIETDKFLCREFADRIIDTILLMGHHLEAQHIVIRLRLQRWRKRSVRNMLQLRFFQCGHFIRQEMSRCWFSR